MKSQTAVRVRFPLCDFQRIKNLSLKRGSVFAFDMTENWATLVNGDKAEKQIECHLPDKLYCATHKHHTATLCVCPALSCSHTHPQPHTHWAALANKSWKSPFEGPENTIRDSTPGLNWLPFSNCANGGVQRHLFAPCLQVVLACGTQTSACCITQRGWQCSATWDQTVLLQRVFDSARQRGESKKEGEGGTMGSTGSSCSDGAQ